MAQMSFEDFISTGYTFPDTGGTLVITIDINDFLQEFEISGMVRSNIVSFAVTENDNEVEVIETIPGEDYAAVLLAEGDYVEITIEVSESPSDTDDNEAFWVFYNDGGDYSTAYIGQDGYTPPTPPGPPTPTWEDGQHKIYRSGNQVMKMYRNGELIYLRLNPPTE